MSHEHTHHHTSGVQSREEAVAMLKYMAKHNSSHTAELITVSREMEKADKEAYEKILAAVQCYEKGNDLLLQALACLK